MSRRIILWNPPQSTVVDDAGVSIAKSLLPPSYPPGPYERPSLGPFNYVPPLTFICLQKLVPFPDQVHCLNTFRLIYRSPSSPHIFGLIRALIPYYDDENSTLDLSHIDPRLWAILIQIYSHLPASLHHYSVPLSDKHLPLLQQIPNTPFFSLITALALPKCGHLTDDTIVELKQLNGLSALDASSTQISANGVRILSGTRTWGECPGGTREKKGPWALRILNLRNCRRLDDAVFGHLYGFMLLSVVGTASLWLFSTC